MHHYKKIYFAAGISAALVALALGMRSIIRAPLIENNLSSSSDVLHNASSAVSPSSLWHDFSGHTVYGDQFAFSIRYPQVWTLGELRGTPTLFKDTCTLELGAGGSGSDGWIPLSTETVHVGQLVGSLRSYRLTSRPETERAFVSFSGDYNFELQYDTQHKSCVNDLRAILQTFQERTSP